MKKPKYRIIDHPSDTGIDFFGKDLSESFINAARGMYSIMIEEPDYILEKKERAIEIDEKDIACIQDLLVLWLERLLYDFDTDQVIYCDIDIKEIRLESGKGHMLANCSYTGIEPRMVKLGIKAVTYQDLYVKEYSGGYKGRVIFDV